MRDLGTLPGDSSSHAFRINKKGDVVGYSSGPNGNRAFLWTAKDGMQNLGTLPGGDFSQAYDINNDGDVVGMSESLRGLRAFLWTQKDGRMQDLNTLIPASRLVLTVASSINDKGEILALGDDHQVHDEHENEFVRAFLLIPQ
jgi:probable HAF family extracellular repeat protein